MTPAVVKVEQLTSDNISVTKRPAPGEAERSDVKRIKTDEGTSYSTVSYGALS
jgi:hypothetical protein